jgi:hypothetical protein
MSRVRLMLLGLLAAVAVYAVGPAAASAEQKKCKAGLPHLVFCYDNGVEIGTPVQAVAGLSGLSLLAATVGGTEVKIHCKKDDFSGELELLGKNKGEILFLECKLVKPTTCTLTATEETDIHVNVLSQLVGAAGAPEVNFAGAGAGEKFVEITLTGASCPEGLSKTFEVTGNYTCELPKGEESLVEHEVVCKKMVGLKLKFGANEATFSSTANIHLATTNVGLGWFVGLGT